MVERIRRAGAVCWALCGIAFLAVVPFIFTGYKTSIAIEMLIFAILASLAVVAADWLSILVARQLRMPAVVAAQPGHAQMPYPQTWVEMLVCQTD